MQITWGDYSSALQLGVISFLVTLVFGLGIYLPVVLLKLYIDHRINPKPTKTLSFEEKNKALIERLSSAATEVDKVIEEMQATVKQRETAVVALEQQVSELTARKQDLETLAEDLKQNKLSNPVVEHLLQTLELKQQHDERKDNLKNWMFFFLGLLASIPANIISGLIQQWLFGGG